MKLFLMLIAVAAAGVAVGWSLRTMHADPVPPIVVAESAQTPLERAQVEAKSANKTLLVYSFAGSFEPSARFETEIWMHPDWRAWVASHAVDLRLDIEKDVAFAKQYRMEPYPTILVLRPDGSEIDRLVGFREIPDLLHDVEEALQGRTTLVRAKAKLVGKENDPMEREHYGDALVRAGRFEEALAEYLWCFDNGRDSGGYGGVRLSFLLSDIEDLGKQYPPAIRALEDRRDAGEQRVREASLATINPRDQKAMRQLGEDIQEVARLNERLGTPDRVIALYQDLCIKGRPNAIIRSAFSFTLVEPLVAKRRYQDALDLFDRPEGFVTGQIDMVKMASSMSKEGAADMLKPRTVKSGCQIYEALLGTNQSDRASKIAETLLGFVPDASTYVTLIEAATRAGDVASARNVGNRGLNMLRNSDLAVVRDAVDRIPN